MAGIGHRGFMGRNKGGLTCGSPPPGFRFLHDEISDGVVAMSQIQCKSTYNCEDVFRVGNTSGSASGLTYPLVNGVVDYAQILSDYPAPTAASYINQLDFLNQSTGGTFDRWDTIEIGKGQYNMPRTPISSDNPQTIVMVLKNPDLDLGDNYNMLTMNSNLGLGLIYTSNNLRLQIRGPVGANQNAWKEYSGTRVAGIKLLIATYDGSNNRSGLELFINDMETPLSFTLGGISTNMTTVNFTGANFTSNDVYKPEMHVFNSLLSQSERKTVKEILEQQYTFT